jgi:DNA (cytosine-5)-methyltransferase 1
MKLLSLCTGYGGLDLAVEEFFGAELIGCADIDKSANLAIDKHFGVPNYGDIRNILGLDIEFDILTAGYPCQPFSHAGQRKGINDERHIWPHIAQIIGKFRPGIVVLENVRGHLSLGFKEVLKDLTELGYDARWQVVRASDVGAPHQRARLFVIADANGTTREQSRRTDRAIRSKRGEIFNGSDRQEPGSSFEIASDTDAKQLSADGQMSRLGRRFATRSELSMQANPDPLVDGRLNVKYVEYMMGLPEGWVTDLPISRAQQFKLLGNGVVPQQAFYGLEQLCRHAV